MEDMIPCDICGQMVPFSSFLNHQTLCFVALQAALNPNTTPSPSQTPSAPLNSQPLDFSFLQSLNPNVPPSAPTPALTPAPSPLTAPTQNPAVPVSDLLVTSNVLKTTVDEVLFTFKTPSDFFRWIIESWKRLNKAGSEGKQHKVTDARSENDFLKEMLQVTLNPAEGQKYTYLRKLASFVTTLQAFGTQSKASSSGDALITTVQDHLLLALQKFLQQPASNSQSQPFFSVLSNETPELLKKLIDSYKTTEEVVVAFNPFLTWLRYDFQEALKKSLNDNNIITLYRRLEEIIVQPRLVEMIFYILKQELKQSSSWTARDMELRSFFGLFFYPSSLPSPRAQYFSTITHYPFVRQSEVNFVKTLLRQTLRDVQESLHGVFKKMFLSPQKDHLLSWIATYLQINEVRTRTLKNDPLANEMKMMCSSDESMINLFFVLIAFCKPFLEYDSDKAKLINVKYIFSKHRINYSTMTKLNPNLAQPIDVSQEKFNFISEMFFLTLHSMHVGLLPAMKKFISLSSSLSQIHSVITNMKNSMGDAFTTTPEGADMNKKLIMFSEACDGYETHILEPLVLQDVARFCILIASTLMRMGAKINQSQFDIDAGVFGALPEYILKDFVELLVYLVQLKPDAFNLVNLNPIVDLGVLILKSSHVIKSPIIRSKVATLFDLLQKKPSGEGWMSVISFRTTIIENTLAQTYLTSGLMNLYVDVDIVEGLDVDKDSFDKYSTRRSISGMFNDLWDVEMFRNAIKKEVQGNEPLVTKFIGTVLNDLIHLLNDSLGRLRDIKEIQIAKRSEEWDKQDPAKKQERENYYQVQLRSTRGFLSLATCTLDLLHNFATEMTNEFLRPSLIDRVSSMLNQFFESLCGPKNADLKVDNMDQFGFNPKALLTKIVTVTCCFIHSSAFMDSLGGDMDFTPSVYHKAYSILSRDIMVEPVLLDNFLCFVRKAEQVRKSHEDGRSERKDTVMEDSQNEAGELSIDPAQEKLYVEEMSTLGFFDAFDMKSEKGGYDHHYNSNILATVGESPEKMKRLAEESQMMATSLPVSFGSSIFVRCDEDRLDVMKALITGPHDTPYAGGCFVFDVFFPNTYPNDPPLVNLMTTGNGTVRFNPNLYNCGKVCLSLLGTWHGDENSKWNSKSSNLHQVMVSIQALIMVEKPYFNEPAYETERGTKEGEKRSKEYNEVLRLGTIRHAMIGQLRSPVKGFENVIQRHFQLQRDFLVKLCDKWTAESSELNKQKFAKSAEELKKELNSLPPYEKSE